MGDRKMMKITHLYLPVPQKEKLKEFSDQMGLSVSELVRHAIQEYIDRMSNKEALEGYRKDKLAKVKQKLFEKRAVQKESKKKSKEDEVYPEEALARMKNDFEDEYEERSQDV